MRRVYDSITYLNRILLVTARRRPCICLSQKGIWHGFQPHAPVRGARPAISGQAFARRARARLSRDRRPLRRAASQRADRKSVVPGKSVSVRVDLGGRRILKKKQQRKHDTEICKPTTQIAIRY